MDDNKILNELQEQHGKYKMKRENIDPKSIRARMNHQWSDNQKIPLADFIIDNIEWDKTLESIEDIHKKLLEF